MHLIVYSILYEIFFTNFITEESTYSAELNWEKVYLTLETEIMQQKRALNIYTPSYNYEAPVSSTTNDKQNTNLDEVITTPQVDDKRERPNQ